MALRSIAMTIAALASVLVLGSVCAAQAQEPWPGSRITLVVPASAGSGTDIMARKMSEQLATALKTTFIVENRAGASGVIGTNVVVKAPPDGQTLLYTNASFAVIAPAILKSMPYDPERDLMPVAQTTAGGVYLLVNKDLPAKNLKELDEVVLATIRILTGLRKNF